MTIREAKTFGQSELKNFSPSASLDVNCLLEHILQCDKTFLLLHVDYTLSPKQESDFLAAIKKRKTGLPIAYIINHKEFYGYDFYVTPDVLIPKPDTEILVENAIEAILSFNQNRQFGENSVANQNRLFGGDHLKICDMCTGSGCIGIAVYLSLKEKLQNDNLPEITFVDISKAALDIAKKNAERLTDRASQFHFIKSNLFENVADTFDFILTNPPYIPSKMVDELLRDGRNEPRLALDGDGMTHNVTPVADGLGIIRNLIPQMKNHLNPSGIFFMESGEYNAEEAARLCEENGFKNVKIIRDLEGQFRVVTNSNLKSAFPIP